jgi:hypothetical protein
MLTGTPLSRLAPAESPQGNQGKLLRRYEACEKIAIPGGALGRGSESEFFAAQPPCTLAMEACAGAHHWAREFGKLGHTVRLIPPAYVDGVGGRGHGFTLDEDIPGDE